MKTPTASRGEDLDQPAILIVSDEAAFAHVLKERWNHEALAPAFTLMGSDLCRELDVDVFTVAVVGPLGSDALSAVMNALHPTGKPVILVCRNALQADAVRKAHPGTALVFQQEGWADVVVALASQMILRQQAVLELEHLEIANRVLERQAALGRYILEMRHTLNN